MGPKPKKLLPNQSALNDLFEWRKKNNLKLHSGFDQLSEHHRIRCHKIFTLLDWHSRPAKRKWISVSSFVGPYLANQKKSRKSTFHSFGINHRFWVKNFDCLSICAHLKWFPHRSSLFLFLHLAGANVRNGSRKRVKYVPTPGGSMFLLISGQFSWFLQVAFAGAVLIVRSFVWLVATGTTYPTLCAVSVQVFLRVQKYVVCVHKISWMVLSSFPYFCFPKISDFPSVSSGCYWSWIRIVHGCSVEVVNFFSMVCSWW